MKIKTAELTGTALDWAVAKCEDVVSDDIDDFCLSCEGEFNYSVNWTLAGPIIEREKIGLFFDVACGNRWRGYMRSELDLLAETPLIAAMRCYVAARLGDEVDVPDELLEGDLS